LAGYARELPNNRLDGKCSTWAETWIHNICVSNSSTSRFFSPDTPLLLLLRLLSCFYETYNTTTLGRLKQKQI